jgi:predicted ATPase
MPLGVEKAAAWVKLISCQEILTEIESNANFLVANWRNIPERQHSLQAVFDTSWQLLNPEEKEALCRLAVFQGGFRWEAAAQVAGAHFMLAALVDNHLRRMSNVSNQPVLRHAIESSLTLLHRQGEHPACYYLAICWQQAFKN